MKDHNGYLVVLQGQIIEIPGDWKNYSSDFSLWHMSYLILLYFRNRFEYDMEWSLQNLFMVLPRHNIAYFSHQKFCNLTDIIIKEQNWQSIIDEIWNNRQLSDYTGKNVQKRDYMRSWMHSRTMNTVSL